LLSSSHIDKKEATVCHVPTPGSPLEENESLIEPDGALQRKQPSSSSAFLYAGWSNKNATAYFHHLVTQTTCTNRWGIFLEET
jgi:hypothetical protein